MIIIFLFFYTMQAIAYGLGSANGIPVEWIERMDKGSEILDQAITAVSSA